MADWRSPHRPFYQGCIPWHPVDSPHSPGSAQNLPVWGQARCPQHFSDLRLSPATHSRSSVRRQWFRYQLQLTVEPIAPKELGCYIAAKSHCLKCASEGEALIGIAPPNYRRMLSDRFQTGQYRQKPAPRLSQCTLQWFYWLVRR